MRSEYVSAGSRVPTRRMLKTCARNLRSSGRQTPFKIGTVRKVLQLPHASSRANSALRLTSAIARTVPFGARSQWTIAVEVATLSDQPWEEATFRGSQLGCVLAPASEPSPARDHQRRQVGWIRPIRPVAQASQFTSSEYIDNALVNDPAGYLESCQLP